MRVSRERRSQFEGQGLLEPRNQIREAYKLHRQLTVGLCKGPLAVVGDHEIVTAWVVPPKCLHGHRVKIRGNDYGAIPEAGHQTLPRQQTRSWKGEGGRGDWI
jgi:hypothetical protein